MSGRRNDDLETRCYSLMRRQHDSPGLTVDRRPSFAKLLSTGSLPWNEDIALKEKLFTVWPDLHGCANAQPTSLEYHGIVAPLVEHAFAPPIALGEGIRSVKTATGAQIDH
nr:hypothetical protein CFP56_13239 [Quercus suber]